MAKLQNSKCTLGAYHKKREVLIHHKEEEESCSPAFDQFLATWELAF